MQLFSVCLILTIFLLYLFFYCNHGHFKNEPFKLQMHQEIPTKLFLSPKKSLDAVYCIYMPERLEYIKTLFVKEKIENVIFVKAVVDSDLTEFDQAVFSNALNKNSILYGKPTKLAVHLSYLLCMYHALSSKYDTILILEDDVIFAKPWAEILNYIQEFMSHNVLDILYLGYCYLNCNAVVTPLDKNIVQLDNKTGILCKHAIVHRTRYFHHFFKIHEKLTQYSDHYFNQYYKKYGIHRGILKSPVIFQNRKELKSLNNNMQKLSFCNF